jgi:hypothetical protein
MARNTGNKRIPVKWVRDKAKAAYNKKDTCYICGSTVDLELHHTHSMTLLLTEWAYKMGYDISTDEGIVEVRDEFIATYHKEIYNDVYTLCNSHHVDLHGVYGKSPSLLSASKQGIWIERQKTKWAEQGVPLVEVVDSGMLLKPVVYEPGYVSPNIKALLDEKENAPPKQVYEPVKAASLVRHFARFY